MWGEERCDARRAAARLLTSWCFLLALAAWAVNDQVAKFRWPGVVTGKASDVLGVLVLPLLIASVISLVIGRASRRMARLVGELSSVVVALGFAAVKLSQPLADAVGAVWTVVLPSSLLADRTDLIALLAAPVAVWTWRRVVDRAPTVESPTLTTGRVTSGGLGRVPRVVASLVVVVAASIVTTATSCYDPDAVVQVYLGQDGKAYAVTDNGRFSTSDDGVDWFAAEEGAERAEPVVDQPLAPPTTTEEQLLQEQQLTDEELDELDAKPERVQSQEVCGSTTCWYGVPSFTITERDVGTGAERTVRATGTTDCGSTQPFAAMTVIQVDQQDVLIAGNASDGIVRVVAGEPPTYHGLNATPTESTFGFVNEVLANSVHTLSLVAIGVAVVVALGLWAWGRFRRRSS